MSLEDFYKEQKYKAIMATCALEGNEVAINLLKIKDRDIFIRECEKILYGKT